MRSDVSNASGASSFQVPIAARTIDSAQESDVVEEREASWSEFHRYGVLDTVARKQFEEHQQRVAAAGRKIKPVDTRWSHTNKSNEARPEMRSGFDAREMERVRELDVTEIAGNASDLFASMPPIEAIRMIFSLRRKRRLSIEGKSLKVSLFDFNRAYVNASAAREHLYTSRFPLN